LVILSRLDFATSLENHSEKINLAKSFKKWRKKEILGKCSQLYTDLSFSMVPTDWSWHGPLEGWLVEVWGVTVVGH
jgi:hypothetical protein